MLRRAVELASVLWPGASVEEQEISGVDKVQSSPDF